MPTFTVVGGANGAGKSTLTRLGREGFQDSAVLDPDAIARSMQRLDVRSGSAFDAGRTVLNMAEGFWQPEAVSCRDDIIGQYLSADDGPCEETGYSVVLIYVGTSDVSINIERVKIRVANGGHDVPEEDQLRRYPRSFVNFRKALELADEAVVFDNSTAKGHTKVAVKDANGIEIFEPVPTWAMFLID